MTTIHHLDHSLGDVALHFPDGFVMVICVSKSSKIADICLSDIVNVAVPRSHGREAVENIDATKHPMDVDTEMFPRKYATHNSGFSNGNYQQGKGRKCKTFDPHNEKN